MAVAPEAPGARQATGRPRTTLPGPARGTEPGGERRRALTRLRATDTYAVVGAGASALSLTWLLFAWVLPFNGAVGFVVMAYGLFLLIYALLVSFDEDGPAIVDRIAAAVVRSMGVLLVVILAFVVVYALVEGRKALVHLNFFTQDMKPAGPLEPLSVGGALHAAAGTLIMITIALMITVPAGLVCAVFLTEVPGGYARFVRTIVEAMTALPSIVAGLFVYATVILGLGLSQSGLAAGLALSVMMLPIIIRAADVVIRLMPGTLREASYAMGTSRWSGTDTATTGRPTSTTIRIGSWSSTVVRGDQAEVDACWHAVQWTGPAIGTEDGYELRTVVIVGHDYCGFDRFATLSVGTRVNISTPRGTWTY